MASAALNSKRHLSARLRYTYRVLQAIQMKLILLCVWAVWAVLGSAKGQIISKWFFGAFDFLQKMNKNKSL